MNTQLYIPDKLKVGFQKREDTYTKLLGFVIYFDNKGVLRKEKQWEGWRDKKITPVEYTNEPTEGFVLNRDVGGARRSYGWDTRIEKVRVYDPRNFEFEIDIPNLLFILKECDCSRGKGLEGKFVYAWRGNNLILLPADCEEYKASKGYTDLQGKSVKIKELIPGASYLTKKQELLSYLGRYDYHYLTSGYYGDAGVACVEKRLIFWNDAKPEYGDKTKPIGFVCLKDPKSIAVLNSDTVRDDFAELVQKYHKSEHGSKVVNLFLKEGKDKQADDRSYSWYYQEGDYFVYAVTHYDWQTKKQDYTQTSSRWSIKEGKLTQQVYRTISYTPGTEKRQYTHGYYSNGPEVLVNWVEPTKMQLWGELESGAKFKIDYSTFRRD